MESKPQKIISFFVEVKIIAEILLFLDLFNKYGLTLFP